MTPPEIQKISPSSPEDAKQKITDLFNQNFPGHNQNPFHYACAPGRVNIIGGHVDYNGGLVLPFAVDLKCYLLGKLNNTKNIINIVTSNMPAGNNTYQFDLDQRPFQPLGNENSHKWVNYIMGVIMEFHDQNILTGFDLAVHSEVPLGGGMSSSAAVEVGTYTFLESLFDAEIDPGQKAKNCQAAEHKYAGCPCGIMDQTISAKGQKNHLMVMNCEVLDKSYFVQVPEIADPNEKVVFLIINSNIKHELSGSEYPERRTACHLAAEKCEKPLLYQVTLDELTAAFEQGKIDQLTFNRARHVVTEAIRTPKAVEAFKTGDFTTAGQMITECHYSLKDDFECSCPETDLIVEICNAQPGCFGGRMFGGGFGGCCVCLVKQVAVDSIVEKVHAQFFEKFGVAATFYCSGVDEGAKRLHY